MNRTDIIPPGDHHFLLRGMGLILVAGQKGKELLLSAILFLFVTTYGEPGSWVLCELSDRRYEVREKKSSRKDKTILPQVPAAPHTSRHVATQPETRRRSFHVHRQPICSIPGAGCIFGKPSAASPSTVKDVPFDATSGDLDLSRFDAEHDHLYTWDYDVAHNHPNPSCFKPSPCCFDELDQIGRMGKHCYYNFM